MLRICRGRAMRRSGTLQVILAVIDMDCWLAMESVEIEVSLMDVETEVISLV